MADQLYPIAINHSKAIQLIAEQAALKTLDSEKIALSAAAQRVLAYDLKAPIDVPQCNVSRMDGYAINLSELQQNTAGLDDQYVLSVAAAIHASEQTSVGTCNGMAVPIMTGAVLPEDADGIVLKEHTRLAEGKVYFNQAPKPAQYVRERGADIRSGQLVIQALHKITAADLGLISSLGITHVEVLKKPRIALLISGDELVMPGEACGLGQSYDANSYMLKQLLNDMGCECELLAWHADDVAVITETLMTLDKKSFDVLITVGGVSMGDKDFFPQILQQYGQVIFHKALVRPGFPVLFGQLGHTLFFGLPGNPVSAYSTLCQYVFPVIKQLSQQATDQVIWRATIMHEWQKAHQRREFMRGRYEFVDGQFQVMVCGTQQSSRILSLSEANCFIVLPEDPINIKAGDTVSIQPFSQFKT